MNCDICQSELTFCYTPIGTARGISVCVCASCGLVQSLPRVYADFNQRSATGDTESPSVSSEAGFGNVRYGKSFRSAFAFDMLNDHISSKRTNIILDVGASRGDFARELLKAKRRFKLWCVEPNLSRPTDMPQTNVLWAFEKIEDTHLPEGDYFNIVHCSHTLEHLESPKDTLLKIHNVMTDNGVMFIEVPNISFILNEDIVEEWFIDKHLYHFSLSTLSVLLQVSGFYIVERKMTTENISVLVKKSLMPLESWTYTEMDHHALDIIADYGKTLQSNLLILKDKVGRINKIAANKTVAIWGCGRIFDAMVGAGLESDRMILVDKYLPLDFPINFQRPEKLSGLNPELIIVASREYQEDIKKEAKLLVPNCEVRGWNEI